MKRLSMCAESQLANLAGKKTLTTRVVVPQPERTENVIPAFKGSAIEWWLWKTDTVLSTGALTDELIQHAPYHVGERVALTETWGMMGDDIVYKADGRESWYNECEIPGPQPERCRHSESCLGCKEFRLRWHPSMFMPADLARLFATITSVSAGRLHDMTDEDYVREGVETLPWFKGDLKAAWIEWWDKLDAKRGYPHESNPWVLHYGYEEVKL